MESMCVTLWELQYLCIQKGKAYLYYTCFQPIHSDMSTGLVLHKAHHFDSSEHKQL